MLRSGAVIEESVRRSQSERRPWSASDLQVSPQRPARIVGAPVHDRRVIDYSLAADLGRRAYRSYGARRPWVGAPTKVAALLLWSSAWGSYSGMRSMRRR